MKVNFSKETYPFYFIALLGLALLTYSSVRAGMLSFTHDESLTCLWYTPKNFMQIVNYHSPTANNHILNTLLIKYITHLLPEKEIFLRLPNLLAHATYIFFSVLILKQFRNPLIIIGGFILINFNPYMLDFFSLARGYGLALTFMLLSIYCFFSYLRSGLKRYVYWYYIFAAFSVLSNFVYLHYFVTAIVVFNILYINELRFKKISVRGIIENNIPTLIVGILLTIILFEPIRKLNKFDELYGQGQKGFFNDTIISFVNGTNYGQTYGAPYIKILAIGLLLMVALICISVMAELTQKQFKIKNSTQTIFLLFLILPAISSIMQHYLLNDQFLTYRLTLLFVPLLGLSIVSFFNFLITSKYKIPTSVLLILISTSMFFHTINAANFKYFSEWKYDANTKNMILELEKIVPDKIKNQKVKLGINWLFEPTINFYQQTMNLDWLEKVTREGIEGDFDYYYILQDQLNSIDQELIIQEYETSNSVLLKKKKQSI
ncbi:MAG: hypothetical protein ACLFVR_05555 [Thiohalospira sp.]